MRKLLLASMLLGSLYASPAHAQLVGTDTVPGSSCAGFPDGATRVTADADLNSADVVLICDGTNWLIAPGGGAIDDLSDAFTDYATNDNIIIGRTAASALIAGAQFNIFLGEGAGATTANSTATTDYNIAIGYSALNALTSGDKNTALGYSALSLNTDGYDNTSVGYNALRDNTSGYRNSAFGKTALAANALGHSNTAHGFQALNRNVGKSGNTAVGAYALNYHHDTAAVSWSSNTAIGYNAMLGSITPANNTGINNTAVGVQSLMSFTNADQNIAIGVNSLQNVSSGDSNISIGYRAGDALTTGSNNIIIGTIVGPIGGAGATNNLNIGNVIYGDMTGANASGTGTARIGINDIAPDVALDVAGALKIAYDSQTCAAAREGAIRYNSATDAFEVCATAGSWSALGGATPGGSDRQIQFNSGGALAGTSNFDLEANGSFDYWQNLTTTAGGTYTHTRFHADIAPTAAQTAGRVTRGLEGAVWVSAGNTNQVRKAVGFKAQAQNTGTGPIEDLMASDSYVFNSGNATITDAFGSYVGAETTTGTVSNLYGQNIDIYAGGGTVTNSYGLNISMYNTGSTITNRYGIFLTTPSGAATNDWGIYQNGTQNNRLNGSLGLSATPTSTSKLTIYQPDATGMGIYINAAHTTGSNYGILAENYSTAGVALRGTALATTGANYGVSGASASTGGRGVYGNATATTGANYGVHGDTASASGRAIYGNAYSATGANYGVHGTTASTTGRGVYGNASASTGINFGVHGDSASATGRGVYGNVSDATGVNYGVYGASGSAAGYGGFFTNSNGGWGLYVSSGAFGVAESIRLSGDISPASIGASQNNYAPAGHDTASVLRLTASAAYNITGLAGGADGRVLTLFNIGTNTITLKAEDAASTAANRFDIGSDIAIGADRSAVLVYDSTSSRWRAAARPGGPTCTRRSNSCSNNPTACAVSCLAGEIVTGGGCDIAGTNDNVTKTYPSSNTQWSCDKAGATDTSTAWAVCCAF